MTAAERLKRAQDRIVVLKGRIKELEGQIARWEACETHEAMECYRVEKRNTELNQRLRSALEEIRHHTDEAQTDVEGAVWDMANAALAGLVVKP